MKDFPHKRLDSQGCGPDLLQPSAGHAAAPCFLDLHSPAVQQPQAPAAGESTDDLLTEHCCCSELPQLQDAILSPRVLLEDSCDGQPRLDAMPVAATPPPFLNKQRLHGQHHQLLPSQESSGAGLNSPRPVEVAIKMTHTISFPHGGDSRGCEIHHVDFLVVLAHTDEALNAGGHTIVSLQLLSPQETPRCSLDLRHTMAAMLQAPSPEKSAANLLNFRAAPVPVPTLTAAQKTSNTLLKHHRGFLALPQPPALRAPHSHPRQQSHRLVHLGANIHLLVLLPPGLQNHCGVRAAVEHAHSLVPAEQGLQLRCCCMRHALDLLGDLVPCVPTAPEGLDAHSCPVLHERTAGRAAHPERNLPFVVVRTPRRDPVIRHVLFLAPAVSVTSQRSTIPLPGRKAAEHRLDAPGGRLPVATGCHRHALGRPILHALLEGADGVDTLHSRLVPLVRLSRLLTLVLLLPTLVELVSRLDLGRPTSQRGLLLGRRRSLPHAPTSRGGDGAPRSAAGRSNVTHSRGGPDACPVAEAQDTRGPTVLEDRGLHWWHWVIGAPVDVLLSVQSHQSWHLSARGRRPPPHCSSIGIHRSSDDWSSSVSHRQRRQLLFRILLDWVLELTNTGHAIFHPQCERMLWAQPLTGNVRRPEQAIRAGLPLGQLCAFHPEVMVRHHQRRQRLHQLGTSGAVLGRPEVVLLILQNCDGRFRLFDCLFMASHHRQEHSVVEKCPRRVVSLLVPLFQLQGLLHKLQSCIELATRPEVARQIGEGRGAQRNTALQPRRASF
mmetsp:Transcript_81247/g.217174  ORF Transcript_81247/g.217174 Transcript_81247/m.217174 type:complete len:776 (+) Transcript_81247:3316-5643(+)